MMAPLSPLNLLIVDDHAVVREGLAAMLSPEPRFQKIVLASSGLEAVQKCGAEPPDLVLLDLRMPLADGFSVLEILMARWPRTRIVMLSASATAAEVKLAQRYGACGYLSKSASRAVILEALMSVAAGGNFFQAETTEVIHPALSARELEVLHHLGRGLSNHDLGRVLGVSEQTIKSHLKAIFSKLEVADRAEAVARSYELGLASWRR